MSKFGIWQIQDGSPVKLPESVIELEKHLEDWIEKDPGLLLPGGWDIICRQMVLDGGRLDLLALDPQGQWVVIELKADHLNSDVVSQALYYAAQIDQMTYREMESKVHWYLEQHGNTLKALLEKRGINIDDQQKDLEVQVVIAGTHRSRGIDTMLKFLSKKHEIPVTLVTFEVYQLSNGQRILLRELTDADLNPPQPWMFPKKAQVELKDLQETADKTGIGQEFKLLVESAKDMGLNLRLFENSVMITSPKKKTITLLTVQVYRKPMRVWVSPLAFPLFYPVTEEQALQAVGAEGWHQYDLQSVQQLIDGVRELVVDKVIEMKNED